MRLVNPPILAYPDLSVSFILQTNASEQAIGAILSQVQKGQEHVISYWSRRSTIQWEALSIEAICLWIFMSACH